MDTEKASKHCPYYLQIRLLSNLVMSCIKLALWCLRIQSHWFNATQLTNYTKQLFLQSSYAMENSQINFIKN